MRLHDSQCSFDQWLSSRIDYFLLRPRFVRVRVSVHDHESEAQDDTDSLQRSHGIGISDLNHLFKNKDNGCNQECMETHRLDVCGRIGPWTCGKVRMSSASHSGGSTPHPPSVPCKSEMPGQSHLTWSGNELVSLLAGKKRGQLDGTGTSQQEEPTTCLCGREDQ
jgi:hypothetical protein